MRDDCGREAQDVVYEYEQSEVGLEAVVHYACRDRNLLGIQSDLLGAHAMGVRNLLGVTGEAPACGSP